MNFYVVEFVEVATDKSGNKPFLAGKLEGVRAPTKDHAKALVKSLFASIQVTNVQEMA